mgnify:CR=1 FL=1
MSTENFSFLGPRNGPVFEMMELFSRDQSTLVKILKNYFFKRPLLNKHRTHSRDAQPQIRRKIAPCLRGAAWQRTVAPCLNGTTAY